MLNWHNSDKTQMGIAYLFLSAEHKISEADYALFENLGKSVRGFAEIKGELIGECEKLLSPVEGGKSRFEIVAEVFSSYKGGTTAEFNRTLLWTLVGLEYKTESKTPQKQQLVELFAKVVGIDHSVLLEMRGACKAQSESGKTASGQGLEKKSAGAAVKKPEEKKPEEKKPVAKEPVAKKPEAKKPAVKKPAAKKPAAKKPAAKKPAAKKPAAKKPAAKKPVAKKPAVKKPAAKKPAAKKPAAKKPAAKKPAAKKPAAKKPAAKKPAAKKPAAKK